MTDGRARVGIAILILLHSSGAHPFAAIAAERFSSPSSLSVPIDPDSPVKASQRRGRGPLTSRGGDPGVSLIGPTIEGVQAPLRNAAAKGPQPGSVAPRGNCRGSLLPSVCPEVLAVIWAGVSHLREDSTARVGSSREGCPGGNEGRFPDHHPFTLFQLSGMRPLL